MRSFTSDGALVVAGGLPEAQVENADLLQDRSRNMLAQALSVQESLCHTWHVCVHGRADSAGWPVNC